MNITSIIYPFKNAWFVDIDGIKQINNKSTGHGTRLIYSKVSNIKIKSWKARGVKLNKVHSHTNIQLFDLIMESVLGRCDTSKSFDGEFSNLKRSVIFKNVTFTNTVVLKHVEHDFKFLNCSWTGNGYNCLAAIGDLAYKIYSVVEISNSQVLGKYKRPIGRVNRNIVLKVNDFWSNDLNGHNSVN
jgi:hypothetical protein